MLLIIIIIIVYELCIVNHGTFIVKTAICYMEASGLDQHQDYLSTTFCQTLDTTTNSFLRYVGNTGLKGRWIYRLENNTVDTINAKQFCLDWYNLEPAPNTWDRYLGTCPCSFTQGGEDGAYSSGRRSRRSSTTMSSSRALDQALIEEINILEGKIIFLAQNFLCWKNFCKLERVLVVYMYITSLEFMYLNRSNERYTVCAFGLKFMQRCINQI